MHRKGRRNVSLCQLRCHIRPSRKYATKTSSDVAQNMEFPIHLFFIFGLVAMELITAGCYKIWIQATCVLISSNISLMREHLLYVDNKLHICLSCPVGLVCDH